MTFREVGPSSLTLRLSLITMASSCMFVGTVGVKKSSSETLADKKKLWKHEVYVALPAGDYVANMFTYGGPSSTATPNGIHFVCARVVIESVETVTGPPTLLQLYAVCVRSHLLRREQRARQCQCSVQIPTAMMCTYY